MASMLIAREVPPAGGDTEFANMYLAYETLSDGHAAAARAARRRQQLGARRRLEDARGSREGQRAAATPRREYVAEHPVVRVHPETGQESALRQRGAHRALRRDDARGEPADPALPLPSPGPARVHVPLPLAPGLDRASGTIAAPSTTRSTTTPATAGSCTASRSPAIAPAASEPPARGGGSAPAVSVVNLYRD